MREGNLGSEIGAYADFTHGGFRLRKLYKCARYFVKSNPLVPMTFCFA